SARFWQSSGILFFRPSIVSGYAIYKALSPSSGRQGVTSALAALDANEAIGDAAAEYRGSTVQLFEKGWMIARFDDDTLYAVVETGPGQMKWFKKSEAEFVKGVVVQGDGKPGAEKLRLGFRWLYFHPVSGDLRQALGRPLTGEIRAWLQFQAFRNGLVIYGVPSTVNDYTDGIFQVVSGIMLFDESHRESGSGKVVKLSEANV